MNSGFKYIDDDLQNLKQLLNFRLDDVMPQQPELSGSEYQTTTNQDKVHLPISSMLGDQQTSGNVQRTENSSESQVSNDGKPPFHYSDLIEFALRDKMQMTVSDIYDWILQRFPYFKQVDESRWKPAVRHTLTTNPGFYKAKKANRGFLWAYSSPKQRRLMQTQQNSTRCEDTVPNKPYSWKKKVCAVLSGTSIAHSQVHSPVSVPPPKQPPGSQKIEPLSQHINKIEQGVSQISSSAPIKQTSETLLPLIPTLSHCNKTLIADSSDDSDDDSTCGECTCKVEYFIPKLPSDIDLSSNSATCIPCCKGTNNRTESNSNSCCLTTNGCCHAENSPSEWSELWNKVHGTIPNDTAIAVQQNSKNIYPLRSSSSTQLLLPSMCSKQTDKNRNKPLSKKCLVLAHAPSVKETKSGHMLCLPIAVPVYKKASVLKNRVEPAKLHDVPQAVAVAESGLLDESPNMSRLASVPSSHSVCSSQSATRALDAMFRLDDAPRSVGDNFL